MLKKELVFAGVVLFVSGLVVSSFAQMECAGHSSGADKQGALVASASANQEKAVSAGNKICPVLNEKIDEKNKATYEYKGEIYNLCCASCIDEFKKDPEKYINKVNEELKTLSQDEQTVSHH